MLNLYYIHSFIPPFSCIHVIHSCHSFVHSFRFIHSFHAFLPSFIRSFIHPFITFVIHSCYEFIHSFRSFRPSIIPLDHFMTFLHFVAFHSFHSMHSFLPSCVSFIPSFLHAIHSFISFMHFMHSFISCIHSFLPSSIQSFIWKLNWERQIAQSLRASIYLEALRGTPDRSEPSGQHIFGSIAWNARSLRAFGPAYMWKPNWEGQIAQSLRASIYVEA